MKLISKLLRKRRSSLGEWDHAVKRSPEKVFGNLDDGTWLKVLEASVKKRNQHGIILPGFPDGELQIATVGNSNKRAIREAFQFYLFVKDKCAHLGDPVGPDTMVLDFGVGWGRIVRCFLKDTGNLFGVDINEVLLRAAADTGCPAKLSKIDPWGALPFKNQLFDLVYAYSVFTHLPERAQDHWLAEICRTLKPGGILVATVQPPRFLNHVRSIDPTKESTHQWLKDLHQCLAENPKIRDDLEKEGNVYISGSETYGDRVMTEAYLRRHWANWFQVIDFIDAPRRFAQALAILRRKKNGSPDRLSKPIPS